MSELIERVATIIQGGVVSGDSDWQTIAVAVIRQMREPTEAMRKAALDTGLLDDDWGCVEHPKQRAQDAGKLWQAMIDAALKA